VGPARKLLIVEDNPGDVRLIVEMLHDAGASVAVESVETQAAAIERLAVADVDVMLLDLGLPDSQGLETFTRLRNAAPGVAIIVLTGDSDAELAVRAVEQGAQDFLVKDRVGAAQLARAIAYALARKQAEREQSRVEGLFRATFEQAAVGIAHVGTDGAWLRVNQRLCDMLGYSREELLATTFAAITHPDDVDADVELLRQLSAGDQENYDVDKRYLRKDGSLVWVRLVAALVRDEEGAPDYQVSVITDITERKQAEKALTSSESRLKAMFDYAPSGIVLIDSLTGRICEANPMAAKILGRTIEELGEADWMSITHPDDVQASLDSAARMNAGETNGFQMKKRYLRPDGTTVWVDVTVVPVLVGDEAHPQNVAMIEDITADKAAEELAAGQAVRIERTLTSVIDIAGSMGEMRDPYTAGHQRRVAELAVRIAQELGMSDFEVADIRVAALLHDMGKAGVPTEILGKPGTISPTEFELIKAHAEAGYQLAVSANLEEPIPELIYQHHERCDGSGYPRGLVGDQILSGAKVLAVADVVEAMMSHRPYRQALGIEAAIAEIERGAGSLYDAEACKACVTLFREGNFEFS